VAYGVCEMCLTEIKEVPLRVESSCGTDGWWLIEKIDETFRSHQV